jgi:lipoyl(octanoyl) transferase
MMVMKKELEVRHLGRVDYEAALALQKEIERAVQSGQQPDTLLLLEHPHTLTIGRRGDNSAILFPLFHWNVASPSLKPIRRQTYLYGLGQIVGYPIINLRSGRCSSLRPDLGF